MEINIITKNHKNDIIRVKINNKESEYNAIIVEEYDNKDTFMNGFELPVKSLENFLIELEKEKYREN